MANPDGAASLDRQPPMAQGQPINVAVADAAADWLTLAMSGDMTDDERQRLQAWRGACPDHERAWRHIESVMARLGALERPAAYRSLAQLDAPASAKRRRAVASLLALGVASGAGWSAAESTMGRRLRADVRTGAGELRTVTLEDGSQVMLNTGTAMDIAFDGSRRVLRLVAGEVMITTGHGDGARADPRPFIVQTRDGDIRALGTRFIVRQYADETGVAVLEHSVEVTPAGAGASPALLRAGERLAFTRKRVGPRGSVDVPATAWTRGQLIAEDARLGDFIEELSRFRPGVLRCDPAVADLRFSGVFPIADTDRILALLPNSLPVAIRRRTSYWVTVGPVD